MVKADTVYTSSKVSNQKWQASCWMYLILWKYLYLKVVTCVFIPVKKMDVKCDALEKFGAENGFLKWPCCFLTSGTGLSDVEVKTISGSLWRVAFLMILLYCDSVIYLLWSVNFQILGLVHEQRQKRLKMSEVKIFCYRSYFDSNEANRIWYFRTTEVKSFTCFLLF